MATDWFLEEYKLVQEKIDKVQANQLQIRSWAVSLLTGFVLGIFATRLSTRILLFALPVIAGFHAEDRRHKRFRDALSTRALQLESAVSTLGLAVDGFSHKLLLRWARMRQRMENVGSVPALGRALTGAKAQDSWWTKNSESLFWWIQYLLVVIIAAGEDLARAGSALLNLLPPYLRP